MNYYFTKKVDCDFETAISKVTEELKQNGFGIVTEMNVEKTFKEKINVDFKRYRILGACNPHFAHTALLADDQIGNLLPCNVVVQEHDNGQVEVSAINPEKLFEVIDNADFILLAKDVTALLRNVIETV